jgi:hypothetical protein
VCWATGTSSTIPCFRDSSEEDDASVALETHGRWPWIAAAGAVPVSTVAVRHAQWRPLAALLWHQTEEWVWPGSFLPWINREVLGSGEDEYPLDRRTAFVINVVVGWGLSVASTAGPRAAGPAALLYVSHVANAGLHVSWAVRHRRYDPGAVTAVATLIPVATVGLWRLSRDRSVSRRALGTGAAAGGVMSAGLMAMLKRRRDPSRLRSAAS